jgi:lysyl-tRNA synthetase class 1
MAPSHDASHGNEEVTSRHWADHVAHDLVAKHPGKTKFVCASGISPSGVVHIGNFREVITVDLVVRALNDLGKETRFLYSWDDYDALRKVPVNLPNREVLAGELRKPLARAISPFGDGSYARHFESEFEKQIAELGIQPEFIYQADRYEHGAYTEGIRTAIENEKTIMAILNKYRTEPLPDDWRCVTVYSKATGKDTTTVLAYEPPTRIRYRCDETKQEFVVDYAKEPGVKLLWRVDWPMRWAKEGVDFEPGGKDHSSTGGSYDTGCEIVRTVWKKEPPHYLQYDFVLAKGGGAKLSSSSGNLITVGEALEVYEPAVLRWLFVSRKPNLDFAIAFDLDVMKAYDEFDRCERFAYGTEPGDEKKVRYERRIYELSLVHRAPLGGPEDCPPQFPFRHLCNVLQIFEGSLEKTEAHYAPLFRNECDRERFRSRASRAWRWISDFAPEEFKFRLRGEDAPGPRSQFPALVTAVADLLEGPGKTASEQFLGEALRDLAKRHGVEGKAFFQDMYRILIDKPHGPKLASFLQAIGPERAARLLRRAAQ